MSAQRQPFSTVRFKFLLREPLAYGANEAGLENTPDWPRFVRITDIDGSGRLRPDTFKSLEPTTASGYMLDKGDVLLARSGATVGKAFLYHESWGPACYAGYLIRARLKLASCLPRFVYYFSQSSLYWDQVKEGTIQATIQNFSAEKFGDLSVPAPPLADQRRIAAYLDAETRQMDALVSEKEAMLKLLEEKRAAQISHAVTRGLNPRAPLKPSALPWLGDIPKHWEVMQLKQTWASSDYGISDNIRGDGQIKVLRMSCIQNGLVDLDNCGEIDEVDPQLLLREGDLLFNRTNSLDQIAKVGLCQAAPLMPTTFASYLVRIRVNHRASTGYLVQLLNSVPFIRYARRNAIPAIGQANLSPSRYGEIKIPVPPLEEQRAIVVHLAAERERTAELETTLKESVHLLHERRRALITAAVTGQIAIA